VSVSPSPPNATRTKDISFGCLLTLPTAVVLGPPGLKQFNLSGAKLILLEVDKAKESFGLTGPGYLIDCTIDATDIDSAVSGAISRSHFLAGTLVAASGSRTQPPKIVTAIDCSKDTLKRTFRQYYSDVPLGLPIALHCGDLDSFMQSLSSVSPERRDNVGRAVRWLWKALIGDDPVDQFIWLWNGLETIAAPLHEMLGVPAGDYVTISCGECGSELVCPGCNTTKLRRTTNSSIIENWADRCGHGEHRKLINEVRNGIFHGYMHIEKLYSRCLNALPVLADLLYRAIIGVSNAALSPQTLRNLASILPVGVGSEGYLEGSICGWVPGPPLRDYPHLERIANTKITADGVKIDSHYRNATGYDITVVAHAASGPRERVRLLNVEAQRTDPKSEDD